MKIFQVNGYLSWMESGGGAGIMNHRMCDESMPGDAKNRGKGQLVWEKFRFYILGLCQIFDKCKTLKYVFMTL